MVWFPANSLGAWALWLPPCLCLAVAVTAAPTAAPLSTPHRAQRHRVQPPPVDSDLRLDRVYAAADRAAPPVPPVDVTTWDLRSWRAWPFDLELLSAREAPFLTAATGDWIRTGDTWVGAGPRNTGRAPAEPLAPALTEPSYTLRITEFHLTAGGNERGPNRVFCAGAVPQEPAGPFPVLFVFHGGGGHASGALALAIARHNPGFAAVAVDYNGQFRPADTPVTRWVTLTEEIRERRHDLLPNPLNFPMYHHVQAVRRVMDWTAEQPWADGEKLGAVGISYGGWLAFLLAGVDGRIRSVSTGVSAGGAEDTRGRSAQALDWEPADQRPIWLAHAEPVAYAPRTNVPVFLKLATNDRFFWLQGAARHRDCLGEKAAWLLTPNCDHGHGGPELPDPVGLWHWAVHRGGPASPELDRCSFAQDGRAATIRVRSERPLRSVHLAWSVGEAVSPARYWRWIEATRAGDLWTASLPVGHEALSGLAYFTAIDVDGRAVSSDLAGKRGPPPSPAVTWADEALWDIEAGAAAWRPDLASGKAHIDSAGLGRIRITPAQTGTRVAALTNSLVLAEAAGTTHRGMRIEIGGNGLPLQLRILLARDYTSLDEKLFAADVEATPELSTLDLAWERFRPFPRTPPTAPLLPVNGLVVACEKLPETGMIVGRATWLD
ncbi:MAG: acetylxylan esterase [Lentisphaeria bacterium]|nr:acetylxylan esterase [Lentisphaeria bacterium]